MGDVVVECNPTEYSVIVVMLLVNRPKLMRSRNIEWNPIQVQPSGMSTLCFFNDGFMNFTMDIDAALLSLAFISFLPPV